MSDVRIAPLDPPYSGTVAAALERIMPAGVAPLALFRTLAVNERVFPRLVAGGLLDRGSIAPREREVVIDRTCARRGAEYEWGVDVAFFGERAGFTAEQIAGTCAADPPTPALRRASSSYRVWWTSCTTRPGSATSCGPGCRRGGASPS